MTRAVNIALAGAGGVLQVVQGVKTDVFATNTSATWLDVTGFTASITPKSASNKVLVRYNAMVGQGNNANYSVHLRLVRNGTVLTVGDASGSATQCLSSSIFGSLNYCEMQTGELLDSPSTTDTITYKVQMFVESGGSGIVGRSWNNVSSYNPSAPTVITLTEIAG